MRTGNSNSFAINGYWQPKRPGWLPSISPGWGISNLSKNAISNGLTAITVNGFTGFPFPTFYNEAYVTQRQSWFVGLQWDDVLAKGNSLGFAIGQPTYATGLSASPMNAANDPTTLATLLNTAVANSSFGIPSTTPQDGGGVLEAWYKWQLTDNIAIT